MIDIKQVRIWNPIEKKYEYSGGTPMMMSVFYEHTATLFTYYGQEYEYATGLNDKNEQEGYRSDIVSFGVTRRPQYLVEWCVCNACFQLRSIDAREEVLHISNIVVGKIIGNIHQPELMEIEQ